MPHLTTDQAIRDIKDGKMVILVDDEDRENEGDLYMAAENVDAASHQLYGEIWKGPYLSCDDRGEMRFPGSAPDGRQ